MENEKNYNKTLIITVVVLVWVGAIVLIVFACLDLAQGVRTAVSPFSPRSSDAALARAVFRFLGQIIFYIAVPLAITLLADRSFALGGKQEVSRKMLLYGKKAEEHIKIGKDFLELQEYSNAEENFRIAIEIEPKNCFGYFWLACAVSENFAEWCMTAINENFVVNDDFIENEELLDEVAKLLRKAFVLANDNDKEIMKQYLPKDFTKKL